MTEKTGLLERIVGLPEDDKRKLVEASRLQGGSNLPDEELAEKPKDPTSILTTAMVYKGMEGVTSRMNARELKTVTPVKEKTKLACQKGLLREVARVGTKEWISHKATDEDVCVLAAELGIESKGADMSKVRESVYEQVVAEGALCILNMAGRELLKEISSRLGLTINKKHTKIQILDGIVTGKMEDAVESKPEEKTADRVSEISAGMSTLELEMFSVRELKEWCSRHKIKQGGNKQEVIDRVFQKLNKKTEEKSEEKEETEVQKTAPSEPGGGAGKTAASEKPKGSETDVPKEKGEGTKPEESKKPGEVSASKDAPKSTYMSLRQHRIMAGSTRHEAVERQKEIQKKRQKEEEEKSHGVLPSKRPPSKKAESKRPPKKSKGEKTSAMEDTKEEETKSEETKEAEGKEERSGSNEEPKEAKEDKKEEPMEGQQEAPKTEQKEVKANTEGKIEELKQDKMEEPKENKEEPKANKEEPKEDKKEESKEDKEEPKPKEDEEEPMGDKKKPKKKTSTTSKKRTTRKQKDSSSKKSAHKRKSTTKESAPMQDTKSTSGTPAKDTTSVDTPSAGGAPSGEPKPPAPVATAQT